jgi:hypothetical protein
MKASRESCNGVLLVHALPFRRVLCRIPIYHSVLFHGGQQIPIAVAVYSALASVAKVRSVGLSQRIPISAFSTPSHVQLSGPRGIFLEAELEEVLLVRSSNAVLSSRKKLLFFQRARSPAGIAKTRPAPLYA